jgi:hypothetical protein
MFLEEQPCEAIPIVAGVFMHGVVLRGGSEARSGLERWE